MGTPYVMQAKLHIGKINAFRKGQALIYGTRGFATSLRKDYNFLVEIKAISTQLARYVSSTMC